MVKKSLKPFADEVVALFADVICPKPEVAAHLEMMFPDYPQVIARYGLSGKTVRQVLDSRAFDIPSIDTVEDYSGLLLLCNAQGLRFFLPLFVYYAAIEELPQYEYEAEAVPCVAGYLSVAGAGGVCESYRAAFSKAESRFFCSFFSAFREAVPSDWKMCRRMSAGIDRLCES